MSVAVSERPAGGAPAATMRAMVEAGDRCGSAAEDGTGLSGQLVALLARQPRVSEQLDSALAGLASEHGDAVYSQLLFILCHLRFEPEEAAAHWRAIVELHAGMCGRMETCLDIRVALVSYFVDVRHQLRNPTVIELQLFQETEASVYRDALTGLFNYRYLHDHLEREVALASRQAKPVSMLMIDIDDFKHYNDLNGHVAGNEALAGVAALVRAEVRDSDIAVRYGGEEFTLLLPTTSKAGAAQVAERIRAAIAGHAFPHGATQPGGCLTVSVGVATCPGDAQDGEELLVAADRALYLAKSLGKNLVQLHGHNLRSFLRVEAKLCGSFGVLGGSHALTIVNLSEGGLLFTTGVELEHGSLLEAMLHLPGRTPSVSVCGRVVRVEQDGDARYRVAMRLMEISDTDRRRLKVFIRSQASAEPEAAARSAS